MQATHSCGMYVKHIQNALEKNANNQLRAHGLTMVQMTVLMALRAAKDMQLSLKELEKQLHVAQSTTAGIAARLEQKALVTSFGDSADKRVKRIRLTAAGEACCRTAERNMEQAETSMLSALTDAERALFLRLLQKVSDAAI